MPTVTTTLNGTAHEVDPKFVESVSVRLQNLLLRQKHNGASVSYLDVVAELNRIFPGMSAKPYYKDFVMHFCRSRSIQVRMEHL